MNYPPGTASDADLLAALSDRDDAAARELVGRYVDFVHATALRHTGDRAAAEDVTQWVFLTLVRKADAVRGPALPAWLHQTTRYVAANANTLAARRRKHERAAARQEAVMPTDADPFPAPLLDAAIAALRPADRQAVIERYLRGRDTAAVAATLGVSPAAAQKRLERALDRLRDYFARRNVGPVTPGVAAAGVAAALAAAAPSPATAAAPGVAASVAAAVATPAVAGLGGGPLVGAVVKVAAFAVFGAAIAAVVVHTRAPVTAPTPQSAVTVTVAAAVPAAPPATAPVMAMSGRVLDGLGRPVASAFVTMAALNPATGEFVSVAGTHSGPDGGYTLSLVPPDAGPARANASPPSPRPRVYADLPGVGLSTSCDAVGGDGIDLTLEPPADVRLACLGPDGKPVAGLHVWPAWVNVASPGGNGFRYLQLDAAGRRRWGAVSDAAGVATFRALPAGGRFTPGLDDGRFAKPDYSDSVPVEAAAGVDPPPLRLIASATIRGRLTYAGTDRPAANVFVDAQGDIRDMNPGWGRAATDADGRYAIGRLKPGTYAVTVDDVTCPGDWCAAALTSTVAAGQTVMADLTLVRGGFVAGHVTDATDGHGLAGVQVGAHSAARPETASAIQCATTDAAGAYALRVPSGTAHVYVCGTVPDGFGLPELGSPLHTAALDACEGGVTAFDIKLPRDGQPLATGSVIAADGKPVAGATVMCDGAAPFEVLSARAGPDGRFLLRVPPGAMLRARAGALGTVAPVPAGDRGDVLLRVTADATFDATVRVVDHAGRPLPAATADLFQMRGGYGQGSADRPADAAGEVAYAGLFRDTSYHVTVGAAGYGPQQATLQPRQDGQRTTADVELVKASAEIAGFAVDAEGKPLADVAVQLNGALTGLQNERTDAGGHFRFAVVPEATGLLVFPDLRRPGDVGYYLEAAAGRTDLRMVRPAK